MDETGAVPEPVVSDRALNRASLGRQLLLERADLAPVDAVRDLVGLQAQVPANPYHALWSRLRGFDPLVVSAAIEARELVRIVVMRGTIHLVTADDCLVLRPLAQPVLDAELTRHSEHARHLVDVDLTPVLAAARPWLDEHPSTGTELRARLAGAFPQLDAAALAYACRNHLALVQVPPRGLWRRGGAVRSTTAEHWLGRPLDPRPSLDAVVLRYLRAFGPATVADVAAWSRLTGLREVVERLGRQVRTVRDERGRELFDVPDGLRPDPDTPAPVRFLPEYDNVLLSYADRSRFAVPERTRTGNGTAPDSKGTVLHDGLVVATWWPDKAKGSGGSGPFAIEVNPIAKVTARVRSAIEAEGRRLARFLEPDAADPDVRVVER